MGALLNNADAQGPQRIWGWAQECTLLFCGALCLMQVSPGAHLKNTPVENIPISILSVLSKNVCFVLESIIS